MIFVIIIMFTCNNRIAIGADDAYSSQLPAMRMSSEDQQVTIKALKLIKKKKWSEAEKLIASTRDPLAAKLYYWFKYTSNNDDLAFKRVASFIHQNPHWPYQRRMKINAEKLMDNQLNNDVILRWFSKHKPITYDGMELYLKTLDESGQEKLLIETLSEWWKTALIKPLQQQKILRLYSKYLSKDLNELRMDYLLFHEHFTNARAIAKLLGYGYPQLVEARIALSTKKPGVDKKITNVPTHLRDNPGLMYERLKWRRKHDLNFRAIEILHNSPPREKIANLEDWWKERHILARRLMENKQYESAYLLVAKHMQKEGLGFAQAEFLAGWLALRKVDKPWRAFEHFEALYHRTVTPVSKARGAYWTARASEALGHPDIARQWYQIAAKHQMVYYGQLALSVLSKEHQPPEQLPPKITIEGKNKFHSLELVQVIDILHRAGLRDETEKFFIALENSLEIPEYFRLAAEKAQKMKYNYHALRIAKKALKKNIYLVEQTYPTVVSKMKNVDLEWALVHAIIRQESAFNDRAKSPAGALGLMQLMPSTAKEVARKLGYNYQASWLTKYPHHNIKLGTAYFEQLLDQFGGSYPLAIAAYNGGPGRVSRWLKENGDPRKHNVDIIDWIEMIPIYETRNYVQRVLEGTYIYRLKLRGIQKSAKASLHVN
jgi:soluble lytic murein transglycosylase